MKSKGQRISVTRRLVLQSIALLHMRVVCVFVCGACVCVWCDVVVCVRAVWCVHAVCGLCICVVRACVCGVCVCVVCVYGVCVCVCVWCVYGVCVCGKCVCGVCV